jgi:hypothetical protein
MNNHIREIEERIDRAIDCLIADEIINPPDLVVSMLGDRYVVNSVDELMARGWTIIQPDKLPIDMNNFKIFGIAK